MYILECYGRVYSDECDNPDNTHAYTRKREGTYTASRIGTTLSGRAAVEPQSRCLSAANHRSPTHNHQQISCICIYILTSRGRTDSGNCPQTARRTFPHDVCAALCMMPFRKDADEDAIRRDKTLYI